MGQKLVSWVEKNEGLILLLLLVIVLRIPSLFEPYWYGDEGIYLTLGQALRKGIGLYTEIVDHKTPIIYWLAAITGSLIGLKIILLALTFIATIIFYLLVGRLFKKSWIQNLLTTVFALLTTLPTFEGNVANGELILMPFVLAGMFGFWQYWPQKISSQLDLGKILNRMPAFIPYFIGIMFGLAILTKVPAGFDLMAFGIFLILMTPYAWNKNNWVNFTKFGLKILAGSVLPIGLTIIYFAKQGALNDYLQFGLLYNFWYISSWGPPWQNPIAIFLSSLGGRLLIFTTLIFQLWWWRKSFGLRFLFSAIWFAGAEFGALLSLRPYPHYLVQVMPPAIILLGFFLEGSKLKKAAAALLIGVSMAVIYLLNFSYYPTIKYYRSFTQYLTGKITQAEYFASFDTKVLANYDLARWIGARTKTNDRIFIWGDEPNVYAAARRSPAGKFTTEFHIESLSAYDETIEAVEKSRPEIIVMMEYESLEFPKLRAILASQYVLVKNIGQALIYKRLI